PGLGAEPAVQLRDRERRVVESVQALEQPERDPRREHRHEPSLPAPRARVRLESVPEPSSNTGSLVPVRRREDRLRVNLAMPSGAGAKLSAGGAAHEIFRLDALQASHDVARLPYTLRILLENVLRHGDEEGVDAVARWVATAEPSREISFRPARVLLQDFTGVP